MVAWVSWFSQKTLIYFVLFATAIIIFWYTEKRRDTQLVSMEHFFARQFWTVISTTILILAGVFSVLGFGVILSHKTLMLALV